MRTLSPALLFDALAHEYESMRRELDWDPFPHVEEAFGHKPLSAWRVLDVGCGTGEVCRWLQGRGAEAHGVDISPEMCGLAAQRSQGIPFYPLDFAQPLPFAPHSFDAVIALGCLEYLPDMAKACEHLRRQLKPGGTALYVIELCGPDCPGGEQPCLPFLDDWCRYRSSLDEVREVATRLFTSAKIDLVPGYLLEDSGERVVYARVIAQA